MAALGALRKLEDNLALRLFDRTTRHVAPTEAGRRLVARIAPLLKGLDAAMVEAREMHEEATGTLRIVARRSCALRHVVPHLAGFRRAHPRVEIDLALTEQTGLGAGAWCGSGDPARPAGGQVLHRPPAGLGPAHPLCQSGPVRATSRGTALRPRPMRSCNTLA